MASVECGLEAVARICVSPPTAGLTRLVLNLCYRGRWFAEVTATPTSACYALQEACLSQLTHYETTLTSTADGPAYLPNSTSPRSSAADPTTGRSHCGEMRKAEAHLSHGDRVCLQQLLRPEPSLR